MKNTYVECLDWTWPEKLLYIKSCIGDEIPHKMLCGYAANSKDEILTEYMNAKYLYCNERGMMSYDDRDLSRPVIKTTQRKVELSDLKPRTRTEYEKVTESIFDLRDEFERGELYTKGRGAKYSKCETWREFAHFMIEGEVYRKIEKEIDWREDADSYFLKTKRLGIDCTIEEAITRSDYCDEFLELCRVALRANGEID